MKPTDRDIALLQSLGDTIANELSVMIGGVAAGVYSLVKDMYAWASQAIRLLRALFRQITRSVTRLYRQLCAAYLIPRQYRNTMMKRKSRALT